MFMTVDWHRGSWYAAVILAVVGLLLGLAGRRWGFIRQVLMLLAPISSVIPLAYYVVEGQVSHCTGAGATFRCTESSYASLWGTYRWVLVAMVILFTLAPILSARLRNALPSALAAIALTFLVAANAAFLWPWVPAWAIVLGAAIAGPPSREASTNGTTGLRV